MPGGKAKSKATKTRNSKDTQTTLALSRNAAHHNNPKKINSAAGGNKSLGFSSDRNGSTGSMLLRNSFSPFHTRNARYRAAVVRK